MKYGINLYPERDARRAAARASVRRGMRLGVIAAAGSLLLATQVISGSLLRERAARLEQDLASPPAEPSPAAVAGEQDGLPAPRARVVWHPKLAALARSIPDDMFVTEVRAAATEGGRPHRRMDITGHISGEDPELRSALAMIQALRRDRRVAGDLPVIEVSTARGTRLVTVEISCREAGKETGS